MVNFAPKRNARYTSGIPFATLLSFFLPLPSESVRAFGVRSYTLTSEPNFLGSIGSQFSLPIFLRFARADVQQLLILLLLLLLFLTDVLFYCIVKSASMSKYRHEINVLFLSSAITLAQLG